MPRWTPRSPPFVVPAAAATAVFESCGSCVLRARRRAPNACRRSLQRRLRPVYRRPYRVTTNSTHRLPVAQNLLDRRFDGWRPNQPWVSDITFVRTGEDRLYLASRRIVRW